MSTIISLRGIKKRYLRGTQAVEVLHGIDLDVQAGEFVSLTGPSGSGKTTLLNIVAGLDRPSSGEIEVSGKSLAGMSEKDLAEWRAENVGFVFQFYNLLPVLSAAANVEVPLLLTSLSSAQRQKRVNTALQLVGLAHRAGHKPKEMSGGEQQRVAIARAVVADPKLLVCDEPTGDLDRATADEILALLRTMSSEHGKTIVMVTHDEQAASYADRRVHLDKGALVGIGQRQAAASAARAVG